MLKLSTSASAVAVVVLLFMSPASASDIDKTAAECVNVTKEVRLLEHSKSANDQSKAASWRASRSDCYPVYHKAEAPVLPPAPIVRSLPTFAISSIELRPDLNFGFNWKPQIDPARNPDSLNYASVGVGGEVAVRFTRNWAGLLSYNYDWGLNTVHSTFSNSPWTEAASGYSAGTFGFGGEYTTNGGTSVAVKGLYRSASIDKVHQELMWNGQLYTNDTSASSKSWGVGIRLAQDWGRVRPYIQGEWLTPTSNTPALLPGQTAKDDWTLRAGLQVPFTVYGSKY